MSPDDKREILAAISHVGDEVGRLNSRVQKTERRQGIMVTWLRILIAERKDPPGTLRPPMPTLSPDDSGSIDVSGWGASAKFTGKLPVRAAVFAMAVAAVAASGALIGRALQPGTIHPQGEIKP